MNPREMLKQLLFTLEEVVASGEILSDELQGEIARTLGILYDRIAGEKKLEEPKVVSNMPAGADLLYLLSGGDINAFVSYLRTFPGPGLLELSQNPVKLNEVFTQLQKTIEISPQETPADGIPNVPGMSSNVSGIKFVPEKNKLYVRFHSDGIEPVYEYLNVPLPIAELILAGAGVAKTSGQNKWGRWWKGKSNPSWGASVNQFLKSGGYSYNKIA